MDIFLPRFFQYSSFVNPQNIVGDFQTFAFSYVVFAAGLSSVLLALWRLYVGYLDNHIAKLYPEIMLYEQLLNVPKGAGIAEFLSGEKAIKKELPKLWKGQQIRLIRELVEEKRVGWRGHRVFEILVVIMVVASVLLAAAGIYLLDDFHKSILLSGDIKNYPLLLMKYAGWGLIAASVIIQSIVIKKHQKKPSDGDIKEAMEQIGKGNP